MAKKKKAPAQAHGPRPYGSPILGFGGREKECGFFREMLSGAGPAGGRNLALTGAAGTGKTALMQMGLAPVAHERKWLWVGMRVPQSHPSPDEAVPRRLLAGLSVAVAGIGGKGAGSPAGGSPAAPEGRAVSVADARRELARVAAETLPAAKKKGIVCACDNAHLLGSIRRGAPCHLGTLLRIVLPLQDESLPVALVLSGLPGLWRSLERCPRVDANVFTHMPLGPLSEKDVRGLLRRCGSGAEGGDWPGPRASRLHKVTGGYPRLLEHWCGEILSALRNHPGRGEKPLLRSVRAKVDIDVFDDLWDGATPREQELLRLIAEMPGEGGRFTLGGLVGMARGRAGGLSGSNARQILTRMEAKGLLYPETHGRYLLAVPMLGDYVRRRSSSAPG